MPGIPGQIQIGRTNGNPGQSTQDKVVQIQIGPANGSRDKRPGTALVPRSAALRHHVSGQPRPVPNRRMLNISVCGSLRKAKSRDKNFKFCPGSPGQIACPGIGNAQTAFLRSFKIRPKCANTTLVRNQVSRCLCRHRGHNAAGKEVITSAGAVDVGQEWSHLSQSW